MLSPENLPKELNDIKVRQYSVVNFVKNVLQIACVAVFVVFVFMFTHQTTAGSLSPTTSPAATFYTLTDLFNRLDTGATATEGSHDFVPGASPAGSFTTLEDVYNEIPTIYPRTVASGTSYLGVAGLFSFEEQKFQRFTDDLFGSDSTSTTFPNTEYTNEEAPWIVTDPGGDTVQTVTDNSITESISSNKVMQDLRTGLYWSDRSVNTLDNEFRYDGTGTCNFDDAGDANSFCDNQDPDNDLTEDNDVSVVEFCLNLSLDANDDDVLETNWRLPTQKEAIQAVIDGSANNLQNVGFMWTTTGRFDAAGARAYLVNLENGRNSTNLKDVLARAWCVRKD